MRPEVAGISPSTTERNVVLPQPDGPTIETNSPSMIGEIDAVERGEARVGARLEVLQADVVGFELGTHDVHSGRILAGHAGGRQTSTRRSIRCTRCTSSIPAATMVSTPTNTRSVWKREPAWLIMAPTPVDEP